MLETILSVLLLAIIFAIAMGGAFIILHITPCDHRFERVDDKTERHAVYICTKCGKVKRMRLR